MSGGCAVFLPSPFPPPSWQDSAGSAEQPFSAAASPPELCRAAGPGGGTARGGHPCLAARRRFRTPGPLLVQGNGGASLQGSP